MELTCSLLCTVTGVHKALVICFVQSDINSISIFNSLLLFFIILVIYYPTNPDGGQFDKMTKNTNQKMCKVVNECSRDTYPSL